MILTVLSFDFDAARGRFGRDVSSRLEPVSPGRRIVSILHSQLRRRRFNPNGCSGGEPLIRREPVRLAIGLDAWPDGPTRPRHSPTGAPWACVDKMPKHLRYTSFENCQAPRVKCEASPRHGNGQFG